MHYPSFDQIERKLPVSQNHIDSIVLVSQDHNANIAKPRAEQCSAPKIADDGSLVVRAFSSIASYMLQTVLLICSGFYWQILRLFQQPGPGTRNKILPLAACRKLILCPSTARSWLYGLTEGIRAPSYSAMVLALTVNFRQY